MPENSKRKSPTRMRRDALSGTDRTRIKRAMHEKDPRCVYCEKVIELEYAILDHRIPISRGGSNRLDNLVLACKPCDIEKGDDIWWIA